MRGEGFVVQQDEWVEGKEDSNRDESGQPRPGGAQCRAQVPFVRRKVQQEVGDSQQHPRVLAGGGQPDEDADLQMMSCVQRLAPDKRVQNENGEESERKIHDTQEAVVEQYRHAEGDHSCPGRPHSRRELPPQEIRDSRDPEGKQNAKDPPDENEVPREPVGGTPFAQTRDVGGESVKTLSDPVDVERKRGVVEEPRIEVDAVGLPIPHFPSLPDGCRLFIDVRESVIDHGDPE